MILEGGRSEPQNDTLLYSFPLTLIFHLCILLWKTGNCTLWRIGECDTIVNFCDTQWRSNLQEGPIWGESVAIAYGQGDRSCANFSFFFNSYIRYLVVLLRFVAMYAFFGEFGQKKSVFWAKSAQKQFYGVWSALLTKFAITRKNDAFVAKIANTCLTGLQKLWYVLISWADRGSCAHKCVC